MNNAITASVQSMFASRLGTLEHLLRRAEEAFGEDRSFLERRIAPDMAPFGTQIAFTCNQPHNFVRWCQGQRPDNLDPEVASIEQAYGYIKSAKESLSTAAIDDSKLAEPMRLELGPNIYAEMPGAAYLNEFLIPNFYFHLVTAYDILRMAGLQIGKADYMLHLMPYVRQVEG